jgi:hypothetical protein
MDRPTRSPESFAACLGATLRMLADDKKARTGLRCVIAMGHDLGYEPRAGQISFYKLQPCTTSASPAAAPEEPSTQHAAQRRKRRKTGAQAQLRRIVGYYEAELQGAQPAEAMPPAPCPLSPPLEPDYSILLVEPERSRVPEPEPPPLARTYAAAARSPLSAAAANVQPATMRQPPASAKEPATRSRAAQATQQAASAAAAPPPPGAAAAPRPPPPAKQPPPSEEDIRSFVFDSLFDNRWDNDLRVRRISLTADAPSFKVKVPRTSRAGVNETLTGEQVAARLVSVMRSRAHRGKTMDEWRKEQLAWLLDPVRPAKKG